ncbi:MAG TPA: ATPase, T2SS/T4P/T4SS family [Solirubrobacteraceae bacterium]|nr:ATPase, T2SS/T4P/T4SS family [Solirubrobacteraceae bacterium]
MATPAGHYDTTSSRVRPGRLLGDVIVDLGFCDRETVERAVAEARESGRPMGQLLLEQHNLRAHQLGIAIAERFGLQFVDLKVDEPDLAALTLLPEAAMHRLDAVPIGFREDGTLIVAMVDPRNLLATDDIAMLTNRNVVPVVVTREDLDVLLTHGERLGELANDAEAEAEEEAAREAALERTADDGPTVKLVRSIISEAISHGASDIHFDPDESELLVRFRVDGIMRDVTRVPGRQAARVISRIKILSELDIAERRASQDGRMSLTIDGRKIDIRVVTVPVVAGEAAVLRILDPGDSPLSLGELGMDDADRALVEAALHGAHGAILATGPTGSGKSTTLYAGVGVVSTPEKTIMTIEDPVEYRLPRVKQMQVFERAGITFAAGLRTIVRADPDIIMVGEMRDRDSAKIAIEAALTGHLMLSSLHTNSAPAAAARLVDMGVEPYLVASSLECVIGQRLVRRLCLQCRRPVTAPAAEVGRNGGDVTIFEPVGCPDCAETGYRGRAGIYEVMVVTDEIRVLIVARATASEITRMAVSQGMRPLREAGLAKVLAGETSLAEVARVTG